MRAPRLRCLLLFGWLGLASVHWAAAQDDLADIVERCERAVVKIEVEGGSGAGLGSGFLVDANGTLVTNVHVLAGAQRAFATFPNGAKSEIRGTLVYDTARDICIAKIEGAGLPSLKIAAELPRKGERVTALGSPHGLSFSATTGIVSAIRPAEQLAREIGHPDIQGTWIQVDAALSGGNSGGPLINNRGEVVGMSTLASQGAAQNLNFGISGADILKAQETARTHQLVSLSAGVGKLAPKDEVAQRPTVERPTIPAEKIELYVKEGRENFSELLRAMRQELSRSSSALKEMRKGHEFMPPNVEPSIETARVVNTRTKKSMYYFRSQRVKDREVNRLQGRVRELESIAKSSADPSSPEALYALLSKCGPRLDPRRPGSIGFLFDAQVIVPVNDHGVVVHYDQMPYLLWTESTAGLAPGSELTQVPVYVAGTETIAVPGRGQIVVTVLYSVTDSELRNAIFGSNAVAAAEWRTWTDQTGKFKIEATLVEVTDTHAVLKKRDGTTVKVPLDRLSGNDREFLKGRRSA